MCDVFIFLDDVNYPKSGNSMGAWCNRVNLSMHGKKMWFGCPVTRESGPQAIKNVTIKQSVFNFDKVIKTLLHAYNQQENYHEIVSLVRDCFNQGYENISELNIYLIKRVAKLLNIKTNFVRQSELLDRNLNSNEMLVDLCRQVNADVYLSGHGAKNYMNLNVFKESGIRVNYQETDFVYPEYYYSILHFMACEPRGSWGTFNKKKCDVVI